MPNSNNKKINEKSLYFDFALFLKYVLDKSFHLLLFFLLINRIAQVKSQPSSDGNTNMALQAGYPAITPIFNTPRNICTTNNTLLFNENRVYQHLIETKEAIQSRNYEIAKILLNDLLFHNPSKIYITEAIKLKLYFLHETDGDVREMERWFERLYELSPQDENTIASIFEFYNKLLIKQPTEYYKMASLKYAGLLSQMPIKTAYGYSCRGLARIQIAVLPVGGKQNTFLFQDALQDLEKSAVMEPENLSYRELLEAGRRIYVGVTKIDNVDFRKVNQPEYHVYINSAYYERFSASRNGAIADDYLLLEAKRNGYGFIIKNRDPRERDAFLLRRPDGEVDVYKVDLINYNCFHLVKEDSFKYYDLTEEQINFMIKKAAAVLTPDGVIITDKKSLEKALEIEYVFYEYFYRILFAGITLLEIFIFNKILFGFMENRRERQKERELVESRLTKELEKQEKQIKNMGEQILHFAKGVMSGSFSVENNRLIICMDGNEYVEIKNTVFASRYSELKIVNIDLEYMKQLWFETVLQGSFGLTAVTKDNNTYIVDFNKVKPLAGGLTIESKYADFFQKLISHSYEYQLHSLKKEALEMHKKIENLENTVLGSMNSELDELKELYCAALKISDESNKALAKRAVKLITIYEKCGAIAMHLSKKDYSDIQRNGLDSKAEFNSQIVIDIQNELLQLPPHGDKAILETTRQKLINASSEMSILQDNVKKWYAEVEQLRVASECFRKAMLASKKGKDGKEKVNQKALTVTFFKNKGSGDTSRQKQQQKQNLEGKNREEPGKRTLEIGKHPRL